MNKKITSQTLFAAVIIALCTTEQSKAILG